MNNFKEKVLAVTAKIPPGKFLTYKQVAQKIGRPRSYRAIANVLAKNRNLTIPCHRVIKNDHTAGGYFGSEKLSWEKAALLLKDGAVGIIPTDTIYGICTSALNKKAVENIYKLKNRNPKKALIILVADTNDLIKMGVKISEARKKMLQRFWPGPVSVVLPFPSQKLAYLHRGTSTLAFRVPKKAEIQKILQISGPLVAPSANPENKGPAKNISEAKKYFGKKVFYYGKGEVKGKPSTLISIIDGFKVLRK